MAPVERNGVCDADELLNAFGLVKRAPGAWHRKYQGGAPSELVAESSEGRQGGSFYPGGEFRSQGSYSGRISEPIRSAKTPLPP